MKPAAITKKTKEIRRWMQREASVGSRRFNPAGLMEEFGLSYDHAKSIYNASQDLHTTAELEQFIYQLIEISEAGDKDVPTWLCTFLDQNKRVVDHALYKAPNRNDARRQAVELYLKKGDLGQYAGFVVTEEKHGGY